ncbi:hypothetical protein, partial [Hymenobacter agri]
GGSAVLTADAGTTSPFASYTWTPDEALSATGGAQVVVNPLQTTTYSVVIVADGRTTEHSITIVVRPDCCQQSTASAYKIVELNDTYDYNGSLPPYYGDPFRPYPPGTYFHVAGRSLTLSNTAFHLPTGSVLLMDPGAEVVLHDAQLYLDGGTITAACDQQWGGVQHDGSNHGLFASAVGTLRPRLLHSQKGIVFTNSTTAALTLDHMDFLHNYTSIYLDYHTLPAASSDQLSSCVFDADPGLMKAPYQPQGTDTWVSQCHVSVWGNAARLQFAGNSLRHALLGVELLPGNPPQLGISGGQLADIYLAGVVSRDNTSYAGAQLTVAGTRFTFPQGLALPATSQVTQTLATYNQTLHAHETVALAPLLVRTAVTTGCVFEQPDTSPYLTFQYGNYRPRQIGIASQRLTQVLDNTFTGLAVGIAHGLRNGNADTEVRGNLFSQCEKGYNPVPFDNYTHPQPTGKVYVSCNTFERGVSAGQRGGVSYGIYQEADANVTLADPSATSGNPAILKNRFDDARAGKGGFYALYNANGSVTLTYNTYDDYWANTVQPLSNSSVELPPIRNTVNYPNNNTDCAPLTPNGLPRAAGPSTEAAVLTAQAKVEASVPNPAAGTVRIGYTVPTTAHDVKLVVREAMNGRIVAVIPVSNSARYYDLRLAGYPAGLYHYALVVDGRPTVAQRLVIQ